MNRVTRFFLLPTGYSEMRLCLTSILESPDFQPSPARIDGLDDGELIHSTERGRESPESPKIKITKSRYLLVHLHGILPKRQKAESCEEESERQ